jgi:ABC-type polar amino acid transport system ATPase subunit
MLTLANLFKMFNGKRVLDNVSLSIGRGEIAVLLGSSGVGKSTLLRVLNNLESLDQGVVELDGNRLDLTQINTSHTIGMVFQQFNLFEHLTVVENVTLALRNVLKKNEHEAQTIALGLLQHYGLADKALVYPSQLSGGQKQRLAIARTIALKPIVICMDEPTSALDPLLTTHVANTIQSLANEGYIILIATHDITLIRKLTCTIHLMKNGQIVESASSKDFLDNQSAFPHINYFVSGNISE